MQESKLLQLVQNSNLPQSRAQFILDTFQGFFSVAGEWESTVKDLVVTDASQTELIEKAESGRKLIKAKRCEIERTRKELKESALQEGRCIDGIANVLKSLIEPIEKHLEQQATYIERMEAEYKESIRRERFEKIREYIQLPNTQYDFLNMTDEMYNLLYESKKKAHEEMIENQKILEAAKIENARKAAEEQERMRIENERLRKEAEENRIAREKEAEKQRKEMEKKLKAEREASAKAIEAEREKNRKDAEERAAIAAKEKAEREAKENDESLAREAKEKLEKAQRIRDQEIAQAFRIEVAKAEQEAREENARLADLLSRTVCCPNCKHEFVLERKI